VRSEFTSDRFITVAEDPYAASESQGYSPDRNSFHDQEFLSFAEPPRSSRGYVIAGVLLVVVAVGYVAWKGGSTYFPQNKRIAAPDTQQSAEGAVPTPQLTHPDTEPVEASAPAPPARNKPAIETKPAPQTPAPEKADQPVRPAAIVSKERPATPVVGGAEELSVAQSYLDGTGGHDRNSAEAVDWLWKSVGKRNPTATLVLADLYLRGDKIPKNCDQARVLLDAAASRGVQGAAMRLRNMQAFGCQ
jgi:TPR repeat protein